MESITPFGAINNEDIFGQHRNIQHMAVGPF